VEVGAARIRRAAAFVLPVLLVLAGLGARAIAERALREFTGYDTPFAFPSVGGRMGAPVSRQVVVALVDGLGLEASRSLPFLSELRARGADYDCRIGEPSLSLPGRAVMLSGAWQEINGQPTNYNPRPLKVEHAFSVARRQGLLTALAAGPSGVRLFAPAIAWAAIYAKDPETAPAAAYEAAQQKQAAQARELLERVRGQPALVMVELHAVDATGHGWGGTSPEYGHAARQADEAIRGFAAGLDLERDTLVVTADHGHVAAGGHGGPEEGVLHVPLVFAGAGIRAGTRAQCRQVDLAPTLSALLGLTVPASNQGRPLLDALTLDPARRREALLALLAQRERFVAAYVYRLATLGDPGAPDYVTPNAEGPTVPPGADEAWITARLDALDRREADAKRARRILETEARALPTVVLVAAPLVFAFLLVGLRVTGGGELGRAALAAAAALALYHLALPAVGLRYSITAVNKDEWLPAFFRKDMIVGAIACAAGVGLGAWRERRHHGARLLDLARFTWLVTAVYAYGFLLKMAIVYWEQGVATRWVIADMRWGFGFYLDVLVVMAVGLSSPLMVLPAWLAAWPAGPVAAASGAERARSSVTRGPS
jgi:type I phosphodiesterase/nucleotide pyrophosphatase